MITEPRTSADLWLERPGARLRWRDDGGGPALLLLHGWALDLELFDPLVQQCRGQLRLLRMDRRGYGLSSGLPSLDADAGDALALLDAVGVPECAVLGMSQGARVAAALARQAPSRIRAVVLDGAPALHGLADEDHEPELPLEEYRRVLASLSRAALVAAIARHPLLRLVTTEAHAVSLLARVLQRYPAGDLAPALAAGHAAADASADNQTFGQPVLVLNGEGDSALRLRVGATLAAALPRARRVLLPRAGHLACLDAPAAYAAVLLNFLSHLPEDP